MVTHFNYPEIQNTECFKHVFLGECSETENTSLYNFINMTPSYCFSNMMHSKMQLAIRFSFHLHSLWDQFLHGISVSKCGDSEKKALKCGHHTFYITIGYSLCLQGWPCMINLGK